MSRKKLISFVIAATLLFAAVPAVFSLSGEASYGATYYSYTLSRPAVKIKGQTRHVPTMKIKALGLTGTCCQAGCTSKPGKATVQKISNTTLTARIMYYYGHLKGHLGKKNIEGFTLMRALSYSLGNNYVGPLTLKEVTDYIDAIPEDLVVPNRFECFLCTPANKAQKFAAYRIGNPVKVSLKKTSTVAASTAAGSGYSFKGIEYTVYDSSGKSAGVLKCDAGGVTNTLTLDTGTYTVKETKTNRWYYRNTQVYKKTLSAGQTWIISAKDAPRTGVIHIKKEVLGEENGSLAFDFVLTNVDVPSIKYNVRTDEKTGEADVEVLEGTYRCVEKLPEDSDYIDSTGTQTNTVETGGTVTFRRVNKVPRSGVLRVSKSTNDVGKVEGFKFKVTGILYNQGKISSERLLEAAAPSVTGYDKNLYEPGNWEIDEKEVAKLNEAAADRKTGKKTVTVKNKLKYKGDTGTKLSEVINKGEENQEQTIKKGALLNDEGKTYRALEDVTIDVSGDDPAEKEKKVREAIAGDQFEKADTSDIDITADVSVNVKDVEYVYDSNNTEASGYETDVNKQIKNEKKQSLDKDGYTIEYNNFDWYGAATVYKEIQSGKLTGKTESILITDATGQTPEIDEGITCGKFTVSEVMTDEQKERYHQPEEQTKEIIKEKDGKVSFLFRFKNKARWTPVSLLKKSEDGNVSGIAFRLTGTNSLGEQIKLETVTDDKGRLDFGKLYAGEYIISEIGFDAENYSNNYKLDGYDVPARKITITGDETEDIEVEFVNTPVSKLLLTKVDSDSQMFLGNGVFALFDGDRQIALFRLVLDVDGQAGIDMISADSAAGVYADKPQIAVAQNAGKSEEASDSGDEEAGEESAIDKDSIITVEPDNTIDETDEGDISDEAQTVEYNFAVVKGLEIGKEYRIKEITAPACYAASIDFTFKFSNGQKIVLENAAPVIGTKASDKETGLHLSNASGMVTIVDTVAYENLAPGHNYLMSGVMACLPEGRDDNEADAENADAVEILCDAAGKEITAEKEFVPRSGKGEVNIEFTFDASLLDGKKAVVFEELVDPALSDINGVITVVASHEDPADQGQSIYFPELKTSAVADDTGKKITEADNTVSITDTVEYSNVIAGEVYEVTGMLVDKETGMPVLSDGQAVTATRSFRAGSDESSGNDTVKLVSGKVKLQFVFNGSDYQGKSIVVFEKMTANGKVIGEHVDLQDENQTVTLPAIETIASTNGTDLISDRVKYTGLIPGESYIMEGVLMDKRTGKELLINKKSVIAQIEFMPEQADGEIIVDFGINAKELTGKTAVVFETCSVVNNTDGSEVEVISHRDINNKAQTVSFHAPQTGYDAVFPAVLLFNLIVAGLGTAIVRRLRPSTGKLS